ncbi:hypothetical protein CWC05_03630 [Pseudoalteromonas ruthenica]|uniref:Uncharacterized protein n=1 Tax=Pseudoalteromonas ruthenica TaxID=151081 RepID=A0A5S3Z8L1_9GAMM|nr:hypothetical protein [Pseudoalteromonas ruthenica]TMP88533.1 hypothetical protein CWC05_03630 [Pseudoalteromonas ruthenica]|tara:strand:+ start:59106 stop:59450 length:345 start_codon:yes stop_codon:yes gene_type:complete
MGTEFAILIVSSLIVGFVGGVALLYGTFFGSLYLFEKADEDATMVLAIVIMVLLLCGAYGFSFKNFFVAMQGSYKGIEGVIYSVGFVVSHVALIVSAIAGMGFSRNWIKKGLLS